MSTDQPPPGSGDQPPEDPFRKRPEGGEDTPYGSGGPYGAPPPGPADQPFGGGTGTPPPYDPSYGAQTPDPLAGMPPLAARPRRLLARIIDALIVGIPLGIILGFGFGGYNYNNTARSFWEELIYAVVYFLYDGYMLTTRGQTFGKMAMKIRVAMLENGTTPAGQPGWTRAAVYALPPIVPCCGSLFWLVNVLWCLWDKPYHQCLHDKSAKTVVVSTT
ncbi:RDD family protein [Streptomyces sp. PTM05]|uniref:RDD family protein n=1 Tax=Streptantibioticus parmotrematis TaxID=2873249 RepID=A0ABS7QXP7_9ACTN|nr:RDD family protein [Streptantibioticus parmotrematis]MBY8887980.1 RDD family protein [Streptantibioticus parmotrematis]